MSHAIEPLYVRYQVPDLDRIEAFLIDFGMVTATRTAQQLFMRGSGMAPYVYEAVLGPQPKFLGAGFRMNSDADLEHLAALPGASPIEPISDAPGGGRRVRMTMADGFAIDAVHGYVPAAPLEAPPGSGLGLNTIDDKPRVNRFVRVGQQAPLVARLGHFVLHVRDHRASVAWLHERLGLIPSDYMGPPGDPEQAAGTFLRVNRGEELVDHHCLMVLRTDQPTVHHCSFEMQGLDAVMAGHDHLLGRGYQLDCGVGRHLLGSQIFDYWRDPFGFRIEHYTDGDVVNNLHTPTIFSGTADQTTQWGARPPKDFFE